MDQKNFLLIDGDTLAFVAASACQHTIESPDGTIEPFAQRHEGEAAVEDILWRLLKRLNAYGFKIALSCSTEDNWRLQIDENYKGNRKASFRPYLLSPLKQYLRDKHGAVHEAGLEADDLLGLWATNKSPYKNVVVVGRDKDFKTIPGRHYQLKDDNLKGEPIIREVSAMEAQMNHYVQALSGDAVDGYPGCPGFGMMSARRIVENPLRLVPKDGPVTRGPRKGEIVTKWHEAGPCGVWEAIVCQYKKAGLGEAEALQTARLARILINDEYDFDTKTVKLWVPGKE